MILYELKKLKTQKLAWLFLFICLVGAVFLMTRSDVFSEQKFLKENKDITDSYLSELSGMTGYEAIEYIKAEQDKVSREVFAGNDTLLMLTKSNVLKRLKEKYEYLVSYDEYLVTILEQAGKMKNNKMFADDRFSVSNILLTEEVYGKLVGIELSEEAPEFVSVVAEFRIADYILIVQIMILSIMIFGSEEEVKGLLRSKYRGRVHVLIAKFGTELICVSLFALLTYGVMFLTGYIYLGGGDFDALLQSFESFKRCAVEISVGEFLVQFLLLKVFAACFVSVLAALFIILAGISLGSIMSLGVFALSWVMYTYIDGTSLLSPLKYCNAISWLDTYGWLSDYRNVNIFGNAIPFGMCFAVGVMVGTVIVVGLALKIYVSDIQFRVTKKARKQDNIFERIKGKAVQSTSLKFHEAYRLIVSEWQGILIIAILGFSVLFAGERLEGRTYEGTLSYLHYLDKVPNEFSEEMWEYIEKEKAYLEERDGYRESLNKKYVEGNLTKEAYDKAIKNLNMDIASQSGFKQVYNTAKEVRRVYQRGVDNLGIVNEYLTECLFGRDFDHKLIEMLLMCLFFVALGRYFLSDHNITALIKSTKRGRGTAQWVRAVYAVLFSVCAGAVVYLSYYRQIWMTYDTERMSFAVQSIKDYAQLEQTLTIRQVFMLGVAAKLIGIICLALFTYFLSLWGLKKSLYNIVTIVVMIAPPALSYLGAPSDFILFDGFFRIDSIIRGGIMPALIYMAVMIGLLVVFGVISVQRYMLKKR